MRAQLGDRVDPRAVRRRARHPPGQPGRAGDAGHGDRDARRPVAHLRRLPGARSRARRSSPPGQQVAAAAPRIPDRALRRHGHARSTRASIRRRARSPCAPTSPNADAQLRPGMLVQRRPAARRSAGAAAAGDRGGAGRRATRSCIASKPDGSVEQVDVQLGTRRRGQAEIARRACSAGDRIVVEGTGKLRAGAKIVATAAAPRAAATATALSMRPVRPLDPTPGLRDRHEPAADRARRDGVHAPDPARTARHRPAGRLGRQ